MPSAIKRTAAARTFERAVSNGRPRCAYCGSAVARKPSKWSDTVREFTMDHVIPVCEGGRFLDENLLPACLQCNNARGDTPLNQFVAQLPGAIMTEGQAMSIMVAARLAHDKQELLDRGFRR